MTDLTHEQARRFLQPGRQEHLSPAERQALNAHLAQCQPCRRYAVQSDAIQARLRHALHARWDPIPEPASSRAHIVLAHTRRQTMIRNTFRLAVALVLSILLIAGMAGIFKTVSPQPAGQPAGSIPSTDTATTPYIPDEPSQPLDITDTTQSEVMTYTVKIGDTVFAIADKFDLSPETILWGNLDTLGDNPHLLVPGLEIHILPVDGVYYRWLEGDTIEAVAHAHGVSTQAILDWPGNRLDPANPAIEPGTMIVIPGGKRPFAEFPRGTLIVTPGGKRPFSGNPGPTLSETPEPASNGLIAFTMTRDGNMDIYVMNPDGSGIRNLTHNPGNDWGQTWSPDGTKLAFISNRTGVEEIFVIDADGSGLQQLTTNTYLAYTHENESGVVDPNAPLNPAYEPPTWSPDGKMLAAVLRKGTPSEDDSLLALINTDGSEAFHLRGGPFHSPQWSPDGELLAFTRGFIYNEELWILDPATIQRDDRTAQMTSVWNASDPSEYWETFYWSPDGSRLAFLAFRIVRGQYQAELRILERKGWSQQTLYAWETFDSEGLHAGEVAWSPDGSRLAVTMRGPKDSPNANWIFLLNADGNGLVSLADTLEAPYHLRWSPDGRFLLFEAGIFIPAAIKDDRALWLLDLKAALNGYASPTRLTTETGSVSWPEWQPVQ